MRCPICHHSCRIQRTWIITDHLRELTRCCKNSECGHVFATHEEYIRTIVEPVAAPVVQPNNPSSIAL
ncbi:ogr/Delta-like zinc finger family protein [Psychrobacter celer]|uniref:ogr/Delta-like zinc finger family protein n=1 Tax=Psychrobacter celer TaxID=306572 RepID=UPI003FD5B82B